MVQAPRQKQPPAFQFYASDYLSSSKVQRMTLEAQGAYIRLLCYSWQDESIPADVEQLARLCGCGVRKMSELWDKFLRDCFAPSEADPDRLVNPRLEEVRLARLKFSAERSASGKTGAAERWKNHGSANGSAIEEPIAKNGSPVSSLQSSKEPPIVPQTDKLSYSAEFDVFWGAYPKKSGKAEAFKAWNKLKPSKALQEIMVHAVMRQAETHDWKRDNGQFIPHPATWINRGQWDDEIPQAKAAVRGVVF